MKQGKIFFISGPSGAGKGTLIDALRNKFPQWIFPVSCTTRTPRDGEKDGETYFFISKTAFTEKIKQKEFLEYANVHGDNFYGTLKKPLLDGVQQGKIVIREFDVQGFMQAKEILPRESYVSIFLSAEGGAEELIRRINHREKMSKSEIEQRMISLEKELKLAEIYDFHLISKNNNQDQILSEMEKIITENY
jgi:guanylate kinase